MSKMITKLGNFREGFIFAKLRIIKSSRNGEITLSFTDIRGTFFLFVDFMKTAKVNAHIMYIFGKIEL